MNKSIIEEIRKSASVKGKTPTWISYLKDEQLHEIFKRLRNGESAKAIARLTRDTWLLNRNSSIHSLSQGILKFNKRIAHLLLAPTTSEIKLACLPRQTEIEEIGTGESLEELARQQEIRIKGIIGEEKEYGIRYPNLNREIQSLAALRKAILKQREWEIKYGESLDRGKDLKLEKGIKVKFDRLMEGISDDGRERIIFAAQKFLELAEKEAITVEIDSDQQVYPK
jgi:hypothetical protein